MMDDSILAKAKEKGYITNNMYTFVRKKQDMIKENQISFSDLLLLYRLIDEDDLVDMLNENSRVKLISVKKYKPLPNLIDYSKKLPQDIIPVFYNNATNEITLASPNDIDKTQQRDFIMRLGVTNVHTIRCMDISMRLFRQNLTGREDKILNLFTIMDRIDILNIDATDNKATDCHMVCYYNEDTHAYDYLALFRIASQLEVWDRFELTKEINELMINKIVNSTRGGSAGAIKTADGVENSIEDLLGDGNWAARVSAAQVLGGFKCILRYHQTNLTAKDLGDLGFPEEDVKVLTELSLKEYGITYVVGKTGSGKTTTINSMIKNIRRNKLIDITEFSNPVEIRQAITQQEYENADELLVLISKLKKQDPDLVYVGEIPDKKIAFGVKELTDSNVQVITTTHLDRCWNIPQKLFDYYDHEYINVLGSINAVISQVMFRKLCPHCKEEIAIPDEFEFDYMSRLGANRAFRAKRGGCKECHHRGYSNDVIPSIEILQFNHSLVKKLLKHKTPIEMCQVLKEHVFNERLNLEVKVKKLVEDGTIDLVQVKTRNLCEL